MGMSALVLDAADAKLHAAIEAASQWTLAARPIVKAIFAIEDVQWDLLRACDEQISAEVRPILSKPVKELREMLAGIRDNFLCDEMQPQPSRDAPDSEWQARDDFQDELEREVISVAAFVKQMEMEA